MGLQVWLPLKGNLNNQGLAQVTSSGTPSYRTPAKIGGNALDLKTRITFTCPALKNLQTFSVCFWGYAGSSSTLTTNWQDLLGFGDVSSSGTAGTFRWETTYASTHGIHWHDNATNALVNGSFTHTLLYDTWCHCCVVFDKEAGKVYSYTNGILDNTYTHAGGKFNANGTFYLGETNNIEGMIQDVRFYNHALSQAEVKEISKSLILHYPLNDTSLDSKPNLIPSNYWTGSKSLSLSANTTSYSFINYPTVNVNTNTTYLWTIDIRVTSGGANLTNLGIDTNCSGGSYSGNDSAHTVVTVVNPNLSKIKVGEWQTAYCITTVKSDATNPKIFHCIYGASSTATTIQVEYRNLMLVEASSIVPLRFWQGNIVYDCSGLCNNAISNGSAGFTCSSDTSRYSASTTFASGSRIATSVSASTFMPTDAITVNIWFKSSNAANRFLSCTEGGGFNFESGSGNIRWIAYAYGKGAYNTCDSTTSWSSVSDNNWHMITGTFDKQNMCIYLDGVLIKTNACQYPGTILGYAGSTPFTLGAEAQTIASPLAGTYVGSLSDCRVYATALSAEDVLELYHTAARIDNVSNTYVYQYIET